MGSQDAPANRNSHMEEALASLTGFIDDSKLLDLASRFSETYKELAKNSTEHFLVTPVTALPTGKEKGKFLSIDVGGTNLRVGFIELLGDPENGAQSGQKPTPKIRRSHDKSWPIEEHMKMDKAEDLFAWIGDCIAEVVKAALSETEESEAGRPPFGDELLLGITFSFPMAQTCLSEATLLQMGKGFAITSDLNLGKMLLAGYARHIVSPSSNSENGHSAENPSSKKRRLSRLPRIRIAAITNDTVATFASLAYAVKAAPNSRVAMGLIVGTGTNATVPMPLTALHSSKREALANPDSVSTVVINTEWTIRGTDKPLDALSLKTKWDTELDRNSEAPGFQPFEYMTAGRYLGEIVRLIFVDLVTTGAGSCAESMPQSLKSKNALPTRFLSEVVARTPDIESLRQQLAERYPAPSGNSTFWTSERANLIKDIAYAVQQRSSAFIAAACIGLLACVGDISLDNNPSPASTLTSPTKTANGNITNATGAGAQQTLSEAPQEDLVIAYTGGTISQYPGWLQTCQHWIDRLVEKGSGSNRGKRVVLKEALDGGIVGAGVLAGMSGGIV